MKETLGVAYQTAQLRTNKRWGYLITIDMIRWITIRASLISISGFGRCRWSCRMRGRRMFPPRTPAAHTHRMPGRIQRRRLHRTLPQLGQQVIALR